MQIFLEKKRKKKYIYIYFYFLLQEIGPSNININNFIIITEIQKNILCQGRPTSTTVFFCFLSFLKYFFVFRYD